MTAEPATGVPPVPALPQGVRAWLRAEGVIGLAGGWMAWLAAGGEPIWFLVFLLAPDLSALGYLRGPRIGAHTYNAIHNWAVGGVVLALGWALNAPVLQLVGAVLVAHTGADRIFGYGLKYPTAFRDTHLGRIGRSKGA